MTDVKHSATGRDVVALVCLVGAVGCAPAGAFLVAGLGWALLTVAALLLLVALLAGWS